MYKPFETYHGENPRIYEEFKRFTFITIKKGFSNYSAKGIFELIRWHSGTKGNDGFKVNNNYTPDYAKMFMRDYPKHEGFFRTRNRS